MGKSTGLSKEQRRTLDRLKTIPGIERFYLAGGSAVAIYLNHRRSLDLDLFSLSGDVELSALADAAQTTLPNVEMLAITDAALRMRVDGVPVDIVRYRYRPLDKPNPGPEAFPIAGIRDLAAMKLAAIARRGLRRDFWDLWALIQHGLSLRDATEAYRAKFGVLEAELYHVLRALTYFDDAEKDPVFPRGLNPTKWEQIKRFFLEEVPQLLIGD